jgi:hypothetical protein
VATVAAISTVGLALVALLEKACPRPEFDGATFDLYQAKNFQAPMAEGVSLFLYRVSTSTVRRNLSAGGGAPGRRARPPLPLDLYYLLTPWSPSAVRQHRLLAWAMRTLEDTPTLEAGFLNHYGPRPETFRPDEAVTLVLDPLSIQDALNVWEVGKPNIQVAVTYVVRMVLIDSPVEDELAGPVQTRVLQATGGPG